MKNTEAEIKNLEESIKELVSNSKNEDGLYKAKLLKKDECFGVKSVEFRKSKNAIRAIISFFIIVILILPAIKKNIYSNNENILGAIFFFLFGVVITIIVNNKAHYKNKLKISADGIFYNDEMVPLNEILVVYLQKQINLTKDPQYYLYLGLSNSVIKVYDVTGLAKNGKGLSTIPDNRAEIGHWIEFFKGDRLNTGGRFVTTE